MKITITIEVDERGAVTVRGSDPIPKEILDKLPDLNDPSGPPPAATAPAATEHVPAEEAPPEKKRFTKEQKEEFKRRIAEMNAAGQLDSAIAAELGIKTHQVSYFRTQMGLKGNGVFGSPGVKKDPAAPAPAAEEKPSAFAKPCCGSVGVRHKKDCPEAFVAKALPNEDAEEGETQEPEEPAEEKTYKCINPSCEKEGEKFQSTNEIPNVMCHDCGEREVVQVFEE